MLSLGLTGLSALAFVIGLALFWFKVSRKAAPWLFLLAGVGLAGAIGTAKGRVAAVVMDGTTALMSAALGAGVAIAVAAFLGIYLYSRMWKGGGGGKITCAVALIFPTVLTAVGLGVLVSAIGATMTTATSAFGALLSGLGG